MKQKFLIGCGAVLFLIVVAIGALVVASPYLIKKGKGWVDAQLAESSRLSAVESSWRPPSENIGESWFPFKAGEWSRGSVSTLDSIAELDLPRPGISAAYSHSN